MEKQEKAWEERKQYSNLKTEELIQRLFDAMKEMGNQVHRLHDHQQECSLGHEFEHQYYWPIQEPWIKIEGGIMELNHRLSIGEI